MKAYIAEFIGTLTLVTLGCGTAMLVGCDAASGCGYLLTAFAFGLTIVGMAYCVGNISGCHINPAVSLGVWMSGKMNDKDFAWYVVAQCIGGILAALVLAAIINSSDLGGIAFTGLGANGYGEYSAIGLEVGAALLVEMILTCVFVLTVLGVTDTAKNATVAGLVIGLTLTFVHILGIPLTGTSVNPARSLGPALVLGGDAWNQLWVFIIGPFCGAGLAALIWKKLKAK